MSKMTLPLEHADHGDSGPNISAVGPLRLDERALSAAEEHPNSLEVGKERLYAAEQTDGARFTLGQQDGFHFQAPQARLLNPPVGQQSLMDPNRGLQLAEHLSAADASEIYNLQLQQQLLQE